MLMDFLGSSEFLKLIMTELQLQYQAQTTPDVVYCQNTRHCGSPEPEHLELGQEMLGELRLGNTQNGLFRRAANKKPEAIVSWPSCSKICRAMSTNRCV